MFSGGMEREHWPEMSQFNYALITLIWIFLNRNISV